MRKVSFGLVTGLTLLLASSHPAAAAVIFQDNFEGGTSSWVFSATPSTSNTWGTTTTSSYSPTNSLTESPSGNYVDASTYYATKATSFSTVGATSASLSFRHRYDFNDYTGSMPPYTYYDYAYVEVSTNGGTSWSQLTSYTGLQSSWTLATLSLNSYLGYANVLVRFRVSTDSIVTRDGWYIDDVSIDVTTPVTPVTVTSPNGGEAWAGGSLHDVTWTYDGSLPGAASIRVDYSTNGGSTYPNVIATGLGIGTTSTPWTLPAINNPTVRVRVQVLDSGSAVLATDTSNANFTIDSTPPATPTLTSPANGGCADTTPTLDWAPAAGAASYTLTMTPTGGGMPFVKTSLATSDYTLTAGEALPEAGNPYTWTVTAHDAAGNSATSASWSLFVDGTAPAAFSLTSPEDGYWAKESSVTLAWGASSDSGSGSCGLWRYRVYVNGILCADNLPDGTTAVALASTACAPYPDGARVWRVAVQDVAGNTTWCDQAPGGAGGWTVNLDDTGPTSPTGITPAAGALLNDPTPTFTWNAATDSGVGGVTYQLYVDGAADGSPTTSTSQTISSSLADGLHTWRVRASDGLGNTTDSPVRTFTVDTTPPAAFTLATPADGICSTNPTPSLCWNASSDPSGLSGYQLWVDGILAGSTGPGATCITPSPALSQALHTWSVTAIDLAGNSRPSTNTRQLRVDYTQPATFALATPANGSSYVGLTPTFTWSAATDGGVLDEYEVWVDGFLRGTVSGSTLTFTPGTALSAGPHSWYVRAYDTCNNYRQSATWSVTLTECSPGASEACTGLGTGACDPGTRTCSAGGVWGGCTGVIGPTPETCNGVDDDCNGAIDNGFTLGGACDGPDADACTEGVIVCAPSGTATTCNDATGDTVEICNSADDDCDGITDEGSNGCGGACTLPGTPGLACDGADGDLCAEGVWACTGANSASCTDATAGNVEACNSVDDDCDGTTDETYPIGAPCLAGTGACAATGSLVCNGAGTGVVCNATPSTPGVETCNTLDDDCDGTTDEDCECVPPAVRTCGSDVGECTSGTQPCVGGAWGACGGSVGPADETCNGVDDDCDGTADEGCECVGAETRDCGSVVGECEQGTQTCAAGAWGACDGSVDPAEELCDGLDNDCDGTTDELFAVGEPCSAGAGACAATGATVCTPAGDGVTCDAVPGTPETEACNGLDDDCDGTVDEDSCACEPDTQAPCGKDTGECQAGLQTCQDDGLWGDCVGAIFPAPEACDGLDNDCDGATDEGCGGCTSGETRACGTDAGECEAGLQPCVDGVWDVCVGGAGPSAEECNGLDDDCDGGDDTTGGVAIVQSCYEGPEGTLGVGACVGGSQLCMSGSWGACAGQNLPAAETCDGVDEDCNGTVDDAPECAGMPDAGVPGADGGTGAPDAGSIVPPPDSGGCGCRAGGAAAGSGAGVALALLCGLALVARRRRR